MTVQSPQERYPLPFRYRHTIRLAKPVLEAASRHGGPTLRELRSPCREQPLADWRHVVIWLLRKRTLLGVAAIGRLLNRDHTVVPYAVNRVNQNNDRRLIWMREVALRELELAGACQVDPEWEI